MVFLFTFLHFYSYIYLSYVQLLWSHLNLASLLTTCIYIPTTLIPRSFTSATPIPTNTLNPHAISPLNPQPLHLPISKLLPSLRLPFIPLPLQLLLHFRPLLPRRDHFPHINN